LWKDCVKCETHTVVPLVTIVVAKRRRLFVTENDDETFTIISLNVTPTKREQRLILLIDTS